MSSAHPDRLARRTRFVAGSRARANVTTSRSPSGTTACSTGPGSGAKSTHRSASSSRKCRAPTTTRPVANADGTQGPTPGYTEALIKGTTRLWPNSAYQSRTSGLLTAPEDTSSAQAVPRRICLIGTSSRLPKFTSNQPPELVHSPNDPGGPCRNRGHATLPATAVVTRSPAMRTPACVLERMLMPTTCEPKGH